jgi:serine/threonine protein kinase
MNESHTEKIMPKQCPQCGAALPSGALEGLCPACLLRQGPDTEPPAGSAPFQPPSVDEVAKLFPQLEILAFIGKGGMGAVYKARQPELDRLVALKVLPPQAAGGAGFAERFNREARALAKLNHPNIVAVHEFGQAGGSPFFIMEFVDGLTLRQLEQAGRLTPEEALRIVPQICEALQFAHDEGIVHRDIKPENILIDKKGRVKIADFGIAKIIGGGEGWSGMTGTRQAMGTPHYMAPEQLEKPQTVDHRADIFSLGVVFYEMLTGQLPLGRFAPPSKKVEIDARLDEVVLRSLEREPELRYQQAGEVKTEIDTIASTPPGASLSGKQTFRPAGMSQPAPSPAGSPNSSRRIFAWLALGFLIVGLLGFPFLIAIHANEDAALIFGGLGVMLALIFGILSWRERIGRVVTVVTAGLLVLGLAVWLLFLQSEGQSRAEAQAAARNAELQFSKSVRDAYQNFSQHLMDLQTEEVDLESRYTTNNPLVQTNLLKIEAVRTALKRLEEANPGLRTLDPVVSSTSSLTKATRASAAGDFVEYSVNKTWVELGDMFDLSTPEKAVASAGIRMNGSSDVATLLNKTMIGLPTLSEGSIKWTTTPQEASDLLRNSVVEVILYGDDLAGVISYQQATNRFNTLCLARQNGEWKIYAEDDLRFTLTKEAAVRQFKKEAENCRRKILALSAQSQADPGSPIAAMSNGLARINGASVGGVSNRIVQMGGALGQAMQQLQGGLFGSQAAGMSNALAQMGGGLGQAMRQMQNGAQGSPINGLTGGIAQMGDAIQGIQKNMIDMQIQAIKNGGGGSSGSFSVGNPFGGPPMSIQWSRSGTNLIITTNQ